MNLRISKFIIPLLSVLAITACEEPSDIGLGLQNNGVQVGTHFTDTLSIQSSTVLLNDSIQTNQPSQLLAGVLHDDVFGTITARTFTELNLVNAPVRFSAGTVADSVVLFLNYSYVYGDTTQQQTLLVRQLDENLNKDTRYYTNSSVAYQSTGTPLGKVTFKPQPKADVPLRITLNKALADAIIAENGNAPLSSQEEFVKFLKGLVIEPELPYSGSGKGNIIGFDVAAASTYLRLYHRTGTATRSTDFVITNTNTTNFNQITTNRAGTALTDFVNATDSKTAQELNDELYLQQGGGLSVKLDIPYLNKLRSTAESISINKATLVLPVKPGTTAELTPPEIIFVYEANGLRPKNLLSDQNQNPLSAVLVNENGVLSYQANITNYIQGVYSGRYNNSGLLLTPTSNAVRVNRAILNAKTQDIKIKIYFTEIN